LSDDDRASRTTRICAPTSGSPGQPVQAGGGQLDGGFGPLRAAKIFEAIGGRSAVGFVSLGIESMVRVAAFKQRYEAKVA
jgi:hypothetical protein